MSPLDTKKVKKALSLDIEVTQNTTEDELDLLIKNAEEKEALEKQQDKIAKENEKKAKEAAKKSSIILRNVDNVDVEQKDYFYPNLEKDVTDTAPVYFNRVCGYPVDREDLLDVFNNIFPKSKQFLFYKLRDKEVYLIIVPLKYAKTVGRATESQPGDFQKHALSFINEGSVNIDSLKLKLAKVAKHTDIAKEPIA